MHCSQLQQRHSNVLEVTIEEVVLVINAPVLQIAAQKIMYLAEANFRQVFSIG